MSTKKKVITAVLAGLCAGLVIMAAVNSLFISTSTNDSCMSCHVHEDSDNSYTKGHHFLNGSGTKTDCAACHLPPEEHQLRHAMVKARIGSKDLFSYIFKKKENLEWEYRGELEYARGIVYNESCKACHINLYPEGITDDGISAHLYYEANEATNKDLHCINCHLDAGHYNPNYSHSKMTGMPYKKGSRHKDAKAHLFQEPATVESFENFTETIPGTDATIRMVAIPAGSFIMGSPKNEQFRADDEGPQHKVNISRFFMSEVEVTWDQYWAFYGETMSEGHTPPEKVYANNSRPDLDAVSGPTAPFGNPDQGWGMDDDRPALTMTHYAAETFCLWLSLKTGKKYRLPTEAEWEYAARAGSQDAYPFEGKPRQYTSEGLGKKIFGTDTTVIKRYAVYKETAKGRTQSPNAVKANAFGLKNMAGNVLEYCSDWYAPDYYTEAEATDPKGPETGTEHVVRGGLYADDASLLRSAARGCTHHDEWLSTDPQNPKSIWWYSDIKGIGFRVVCEVPETIK